MVRPAAVGLIANTATSWVYDCRFESRNSFVCLIFPQKRALENGTGGRREEEESRGSNVEKPPMRNATEPHRHSLFSDTTGSGIIFNINAYSVDRFALYTSRPVFMLHDFALTLILRSE